MNLTFRLLSRIWLLTAAILVLPLSVLAQNILSDIDHDDRHIVDRMTILSNGGPSTFHPSIYPYWRSDLVLIADAFSNYAISPADRFNVQSIYDQNNEFIPVGSRDKELKMIFTDSSNTFYYVKDSLHKSNYRLSKRSLWNTFYKTPAFLYQVDVEDFYLRVNPLLRIAGGRETNESITTFVNQRGLSIRGGIGKNVFFQTSLFDSQVRFPNYINAYTEQTGVVPGAGFFKPYESAFFKINNGRDFLTAHAYVGVNFGKYIGIQLGHNQQFIGDGIRSLLLSDFSTPFFSLKLNTRIWKFHYQNIFAELSADNFDGSNGSTRAVPKKYMAAHYLSYKPRHNITLSLFETVIFNRDDHQFELQYLNPVILYRTVEGSIGSPDNVMLGLNARWDIRRSISFYGQFILDDILIREILNGHMDWWGNKFGHQLGIKYINAAGIENLDLQAEWNQVRPYTYSHYDENANYSHYKQALAHPAGSNFSEWILSARYQPLPRLTLQSSFFMISKGEDAIDTISMGGNIISPNIQRPSDYGHVIGQGVKADIMLWNTAASYELSTGLNIDFQYLYRSKESELDERSLKTSMFQVGLRLNMNRRDDLF